MILSSNQPSRKRRAGGALLVVMVLVIFVSVLFAILAQSSSNVLKAAEEKLAHQETSAAETRILQALRQAYYARAFEVLVDNPANPAFTQINCDAIVGDAAGLLGVNGISNGTPFNLPDTSSGKVTVTLSNADMAPFTVGSGAFATITGTGTWLDGGVSAIIHPMPVTMTLVVSVGQGGATEISETKTRTVYLCEIPSSSLALLADGDVSSLYSGSTASGAVRIKGTITAAQTANINGSLVYGQVSGSVGVTQEGQSLTRTSNGYNFRGETEIKEQADPAQLRSSSLQSVADPAGVLPAGIMNREGLVGTAYSTIPSGQSQLYLAAQPYYSVPVANRIFGTVGPAAGTFAPRLSWPAGDGGNAAALPAWITPTEETIEGTTYTVLTVDLSQAITSTSPLKLFIGASSSTNPNDFSECLIVLKSSPEIINGTVTPQSLTLITPNTLVFGGEFNSDPSNPAYVPIPCSIIAGASRFGLSNTGNTVSFTGSVHGDTDLTNVLGGRAFDGSSPPAASMDFQSESTANAASLAPSVGQMLYITLVDQN